MTLPLAITSRISFGSNVTRMYSMTPPPLELPDVNQIRAQSKCRRRDRD
jgi:hypothetical protein